MAYADPDPPATLAAALSGHLQVKPGTQGDAFLWLVLPPGIHRTVLVVDDNQDLLELFRCYHDHGNTLQRRVLAHGLQHLYTTHSGHQQVEQHQIGRPFLHPSQPFGAPAGGVNRIGPGAARRWDFAAHCASADQPTTLAAAHPISGVAAHPQG